MVSSGGTGGSGSVVSKRETSAHRQHVHYVCLTNDAAAREAIKSLAEPTWNMVPHRPTTLTGAAMLARGGKMAMVVALVPSPSSAGEPLASVPARTFLFPPALVIVDREPTAAEREAYRKQGVSHVAVRADADASRAAFELLSRSMSWLAAGVERMPLPDVLQTMASHRQSGMVLVTTDGVPPLTDVSWEALDATGSCGRLYVVDGELQHAETPTASGVKALAEMLRLTRGTVRIHEVFIRPADRNIRGALHTNLLDAAWHNDEHGRPQSVDRRSLPAPSTWHPPPAGMVDPFASIPPASAAPIEPETIQFLGRPSIPSSEIEVLDVTDAAVPDEGGDEMSNLESLLKLAPDLKTAAKADRAGRVMEATGAGDAESVCAVVALGAPALDRVSELMGLGGRRGFSFKSSKLALYVHERADGFIVAVGDATKNTDSTFTKMVENVGAVRARA